MAEVVNIDAEVEALLTEGGLAVSDLAQSQNLQLFGIRRASRLLGVVGIEVYGPVGLLRSLTVADAFRRTGLGRDLVSHAETWATGRGVRTLYLLTITAEKFFSRLGYEVVPRSSAPPAIAATEQFANLCPDSSAFMRKALADERPHLARLS